jgi:glycosyltransferase involved in cell wall biosynthesis
METKTKIYTGGSMNQLILICAPVTSRSGYGSHSRDLVNSLISLNKFDIKIMDVRWGECPRNALNKNDKKDIEILNRILSEPKLDKQPDIYIDIRIPQEFETFGKFNIGITAGVETDIISHKWIEDCNKMDLVIVPSEHSKKGIVDTIYDKMQELPNGEKKVIGQHQVNKPVEVLFEGADTDIYKSLKFDEINENILNDINDLVKEDFAFLFVGQWTAGGYGEDRKDIGRLIKIFSEAFANKKKKPSLILKTSGATFSILDREDTLKKIRDVRSKFPTNFDLPNIYLLHGDLSDEGMNSLYNHPKIKSMVSFTHGEGFGRPLLEATMTGLPVIAPNWSGHIDFLDRNYSTIINGNLEQIPKSMIWKDIIIENSKWHTVNETEAYHKLNSSFKEKFDLKRKAEVLMSKNRENFSLENMKNKFGEIIEKYTKDLPTQSSLKLPKLRKVT